MCRWLWQLNYLLFPRSRVGSHLPKVVTGVVLENAFSKLEGFGGGSTDLGGTGLPLSLHPCSPKHTELMGPQ